MADTLGDTLLTTFYVMALLGLSVYGLHGFVTLWLYWRTRHTQFPTAPLPAAEEAYPHVTVQLPIYNEHSVVDRLLAAAAALDYPRHRLHIQVVDDSTDETREQVAALVRAYRRAGIDIEHLHRLQRHGYKAGALQAATRTAQGEFIAIFDADFQPSPGFLKATLPYLTADPRVGMIQTRWGHLNNGRSPLTAAQAIIMDKHFILEQAVAHRADYYPKFNGTAGIWRKRCIEEAGGWQADTVCEDLCLSTRAILKGWDFRFLPDIVTPGELPHTILAYKNQQARWAKGSFQCLLKYGWAVLTDREHSLAARLYALVGMSGYLAHPLMLLVVLLQIPLMLRDIQPLSWLGWLGLLGLGQPLLFVLSQQMLYPDWLKRLRHFPTLMFITLGLGITISRSLLQLLTQRDHPFIRTPKAGQQSTIPRRYRLPIDHLIYLEAGMVLVTLTGLSLALMRATTAPLSILILGLLGYGFVVWLSLTD